MLNTLPTGYHTKHGYDHWNKNRSKDFHHDVQMRLLSDLDSDFRKLSKLCWSVYLKLEALRQE